MENFNEGDLVECVDANIINHKLSPLHKGKRYCIHNVHICYRCGEIRLDVGIPFNLPNPKGVCECGVNYTPSNNNCWYKSKRFRKLPPPAKEYRVVEVAKELLIEAKRTIKLTEKIDV